MSLIEILNELRAREQASPVIATAKEWNRDFEKGDFSEWTAENAVISKRDPHEGTYCCNLAETGARITQTLDDPIPVNAVFEFSCWFNRKVHGDAWTLRMIHTDGTTNNMSGSLVTAGWQREWFPRSEMRAEKILSAIVIISYAGDFYVDKVVLGLATEVITGAVEASQAIPENLQGEIIARPKGGILETDSVTFPPAAWRTVVSYEPLTDWKFELAKILVSCPDDVMYRLRWNENVISAAVYVTGGIPWTDWYPWDYEHMRGDGVKEFEIQVMDPIGTSTATCHAEIVGEVVPWEFNT